MALAPKTRMGSQRSSAASRSAAASASGFVGDAALEDDLRIQRVKACVERGAVLVEQRWFGVGQRRRDQGRAFLRERRDADGRGIEQMLCRFHGGAGAANGMILMVAIIWRGSTCANGASVATVMDSWMALSASMRAASITAMPDSVA